MTAIGRLFSLISHNDTHAGRMIRRKAHDQGVKPCGFVVENVWNLLEAVGLTTMEPSQRSLQSPS
jgi:hypothetical protein